jgi:glucose/arabinose dehydrogenase
MHSAPSLGLPRIASAALVLAFLTPLAAEEAVTKSTEQKIFRPARAEASMERLTRLKLPPGFVIKPYAKDLVAPRMLAVADDGSVYVTRRSPHHDVLLLKDANQDGIAEDPVRVASLPDVHGIALRGDKAYLAAIRKLYVATIKPGGTFEEPRAIYDDLPDAGQHPNRTLRFSKSGELYLSVGSTCNSAPEPNPESATMLVIQPDGSGRTIFASGLRNTIGFDWHPITNELWGMDHGIDHMGDDSQKEELNHLIKDRKYGWPFVFEDGQPNLEDDPKPVTGQTWEQYAKVCEDSVMGFTAHSAPMSLVFYKGDQFPADYRNDAFVAFHGSWNRGTPSGYKVMRVKFDDKGQPTHHEDFLTGFLLEPEKAQFGRPCDLVIAKDGALLLSDDSGGVIYRISHPK